MNRRNIKIVIVGDCHVGKTSILKRYVNNEYHPDYKYTLGINFLTKEIIKNNILNIIYIWDTAGSERFRTLNSIFYRGADACILVFDLTSLKSFNNINFWMDEFLVNTSPVRAIDFPFVLVGNKSDLTNECVVYDRLIQNLCKERNIKYFSVSAKNNNNNINNINDALNYIINKAIERIETLNIFDPEFEKISLSNINLKETEENKVKYCYC